MSLSGLDFQPVFLPFAAGLQTKAHAFALDPPGLTVCKNAEFDESGALRLRKPYASIGTNIYPSGTLSSVRKLAVTGNELLAFTATGLYAWSETLTAWISRGEHLAVATTETALFGNTSDQVFVDRAELSGVAVYVWTEVQAGATLCYAAARDTVTGATVIAPTSLGGATSRPRAIATDSVIFVTWVSAGIGLKAATVNPAAPAISGLVTINASEENYDAVRHPSADQIVVVTRPTLGTSYTVATVTTGGTVTSSTKARTADGVVALACAPSGVDRVQVVRTDTSGGTDYVLGDLLVLSTLADVYTGQSIGDITATTLNQIACAFRSTTVGGFYRCYVFWSVAEADATNDLASSGVKTNYVDTNNAVGTAGTLVYRQGLASRAFDYNGRVYVWTVFAAANNADATPIGFEVPVQSSCYLYRDDTDYTARDGDYFAKAAWLRAGGYGYHTGHLAGVALVSGTTGYAWATTERGFTDLGGYFSTAGYGGRSPRDVLFTFDSDDARRVAQVGRTLYVSGGLLLQYDGEGLTEVGFEQFPWFIRCAQGGAGSIAAGDYSYKLSLRWDNARGETERSTTAIGQRLTLAASKQATWWASRLRVTKKRGTRRAPAVEMWRTRVNPTNDSPFYLTTSRDPSATGDNGYVANDPAATLGVADQSDDFTDAVLITKEQHPENGAVLPRFAPPPASILVASDARLFLAGVPGDASAVWYSLLRNEGEIVGFHGDLRFALPASAGPITGLALQAETLVAFTASAIYVIPGDGFDNTGNGSNYGPPRLISADLGALSHDTIAQTPAGLVFCSRKGWYRLTTGWDLEYIGAPVEGFNGDTWVAAQVVEAQHHVRLLSASRMLAWDYLVGQWSEWTETGGRDLATWRGSAMLLDSAPKKQATTFAAATYDLDVETAWIKVGGPQGFARIRRMMVLGEYDPTDLVRLRVGFDYADAYTDDKTFALTDLAAGGPAQFRHGPSRQRVESMRVRVTLTPTALTAMTLVGLALDAAPRRGLHARLPAAQKK